MPDTANLRLGSSSPRHQLHAAAAAGGGRATSSAAAGSAPGGAAQDVVALRGMEFFAHHGVLPEERALGQTFHVDVELACCLRAAGASDDLGDTVDYSAVYAAARRVVQEEPPRDLLESVAEALARETLGLAPLAREVVVRVRKPAVALGGPLAYSGVQIRRAREEVF